MHASDQGALATLVLTRPSAVLFTLPARLLDDVRDALARGPVNVTAFDQDNKRALATGKLLLIDNLIDQATSTIRLKAMFPNEDDRLWPGEFVNARVLLETRSGVDHSPLLRRATRTAGPVHMDRDRKQHRRAPFDRSRPDRRGSDVVTSGLAAGDRVVTDGQYKLQRDAPVTVSAPPRRGRGDKLVNLSEPFIRRPVATSLLMAALAFVGIVSYPFLPVAPLPQVDFPTIQVQATFQGASAETMASSVAAPLDASSDRLPA